MKMQNKSRPSDSKLFSSVIHIAQVCKAYSGNLAEQYVLLKMVFHGFEKNLKAKDLAIIDHEIFSKDLYWITATIWNNKPKKREGFIV